MVVTRKNKKRILFILFAVTIPVLQWLIFYVYANFSAVGMAFLDANGHLSLDNFVRFFQELSSPMTDIRIAFKNTFLTFGILLITFPFKVLVSYFIYKKIPGAKFYRVTFFLPMVLFSICTTMMFKNVIGVNGILAQKIGEWFNGGVTPEILADSRFANIAVLLQMIWLGFPGDLIILGGTFARIPQEVLESGAIDGTTSWSEFTKLVIPMVWPTVALQMILLFCGIFGASGQVFLLTEGKYGTMTLSAWMYIQLYYNAGSQYSSTVYNYLSAVGLLTTVVAITISLAIRRFTGKMFTEVEY